MRHPASQRRRRVLKASEINCLIGFMGLAITVGSCGVCASLFFQRFKEPKHLFVGTVAIVTTSFSRARPTMVNRMLCFIFQYFSRKSSNLLISKCIHGLQVNMLCSRGARVVHGQRLREYVSEIAKVAREIWKNEKQLNYWKSNVFWKTIVNCFFLKKKLLDRFQPKQIHFFQKTNFATNREGREQRQQLQQQQQQQERQRKERVCGGHASVEGLLKKCQNQIRV